jgi:hypothetical protein
VVRVVTVLGLTSRRSRVGSAEARQARGGGRSNSPSWVYRRRLTGRLWNTASCLTAAPLTHRGGGKGGGGRVSTWTDAVSASVVSSGQAFFRCGLLLRVV